MNKFMHYFKNVTSERQPVLSCQSCPFYQIAACYFCKGSAVLLRERTIPPAAYHWNVSHFCKTVTHPPHTSHPGRFLLRQIRKKVSLRSILSKDLSGWKAKRQHLHETRPKSFEKANSGNSKCEGQKAFPFPREG